MIYKMKLQVLVALLWVLSARLLQHQEQESDEEKLYIDYLVLHNRWRPMPEEYQASFNRFKSHLTDPLPSVYDISIYADMEEYIYQRYIPEEIDWKKKGKVREVINQGKTNSSLAIAITQAVESAFAIKTGKMVELNSQALDKCVPKKGDYFQWTQEHGIPQGQFKDCNYVSDYRVKEWKTIEMEGNDIDLYTLLKENPVVVLVDAFYLLFYTRGIIKPMECGNELNHAVLLIGFEKGIHQKYGARPSFILQNSWGTKWGEQGLFRVEYAMNTCGVADAASYPIIELNSNH